VAAAILVHGAMQPSQIPQAQMDAAVNKAVSQAVSQVEARHAQEIQAMYDLLNVRDKQVANMYRNVVLSR